MIKQHKEFGDSFVDNWCEYTEQDEELSEESDFTYIDLNENKESYTAYNGTQVWMTIYQDNCLKYMTDCINKNGKYHLFMELFKPKQECVCHEETLLF